MSEESFYRGSIKAGWYTAQLGSGLNLSSDQLTLTALGRSFTLPRENFLGVRRTAILGIFKRGLVLTHNHPDLPATLVFYPSCGVDEMEDMLAEQGWGPA